MNEPRNAIDRSVYTRRRFLVATVAVIVPPLVYTQLRGGAARSEASVSTSTTAPPPLTTSSQVPATTVAAGAQSAPSAALVAWDHDVGPGSSGDKVVALQDRLRELMFDPGPSDGLFGPATERSVWAFEKFILDTKSDAVTGVVTNEMWQRISEPITVRPRRSTPGTNLEILLPQQVAVLFENDLVRLITHVSTGSGEEWCSVVLVDHDDGTQSEQGICGLATTPGGVFHFDRRVTGWRNSKLGRLYNPVYFNYGIAVHGASNVPNYPASRGCVRMPMHIAEYFPSLVDNGDIVYVFDGVREPEFYGAQLPVFDFPDPNYTTTTSATTTTSPPSSVPASTVPPTTHPHVSTTTTTSSTTTTTTAAVPQPATTVAG